MIPSLVRHNRGFRLLISASALSNLGDGMALVAFPWLATLMTRDPVLIAATAAAQRLPWLLFTLPVGVWTDRADRRMMIVRADMLRVVLMLIAMTMALSPAAIGDGTGSVLALAVVTFLFGTAEVVRDNAAQTLLPAVVDAPDLERANGQLMTVEQIAGQFIGPPLAGLLMALAAALPFGANSWAYAASAALIALIALPRHQPSAPPEGFLTALREGLRWLGGNPFILRLAVMLGAINAGFAGGMAVLVLYAQDVLGLPASAYGMLLTFGAIGGVAGGLAAPRVAGRLGMRNSLIVALAGFAISNLTLGLTASPALAAMALATEAAAGMLWNVVTISYRQRLIPDTLLGRVNSVYRFLGWGAMPLGAMAAGTLVSALTPAWGAGPALHAPYLVAALTSALLILLASRRLQAA